MAGIEKKRSILVGVEKEVVARHEAGHALVATAVRVLIPTSAAVEKLSIIPRTGGALGCVHIHTIKLAGCPNVLELDEVRAIKWRRVVRSNGFPHLTFRGMVHQQGMAQTLPGIWMCCK